MKLKNVLTFIFENAPKIRYYANLVIQVIEKVDSLNIWHKENAPTQKPTKK